MAAVGLAIGEKAELCPPQDEVEDLCTHCVETLANCACVECERCGGEKRFAADETGPAEDCRECGGTGTVHARTYEARDEERERRRAELLDWESHNEQAHQRDHSAGVL